MATYDDGESPFGKLSQTAAMDAFGILTKSGTFFNKKKFANDIDLFDVRRCRFPVRSDTI